MKIYRFRQLISFLIFVVIFCTPSLVSAHPGRKASDGCHYCRTNCDSWGVSWNERHCHNKPIELPPLPPSKTTHQ